MRVATHAPGSPAASRANWLLAIAGILVVALSFLMLWPMGDGASPSTPHDLRCHAADRAALTRLNAMLENSAMRDARRIDRAVHGLITARTHCAYGWLDQALADYESIEPAAGAEGRVQQEAPSPLPR